MANKRRGEVALTLNGEPHILCLTLGALAELEQSLELDNISQLIDRFSSGSVTMTDLMKILGAALRGGGTDISDKEAGSMRCEGGAAALTRALVELLVLTFGEGGGDVASQTQKSGVADQTNPPRAASKLNNQ